MLIIYRVWFILLTTVNACCWMNCWCSSLRIYCKYIMMLKYILCLEIYNTMLHDRESLCQRIFKSLYAVFLSVWCVKSINTLKLHVILKDCMKTEIRCKIISCVFTLQAIINWKVYLAIRFLFKYRYCKSTFINNKTASWWLFSQSKLYPHMCYYYTHTTKAVSQQEIFATMVLGNLANISFKLHK